MIKINKGDAPKIITDNELTWTQNLLTAITKYGRYDKIPEKEKSRLLSHYRHKDIKEALLNSSHKKCAFCECLPAESGNVEVEHFYPKSLYPALTFNWDNLLPACRKCNEAKSDSDTKSNPIINPAIDDPETVFKYDTIRICPIENTDTKAITTIDTCNLNSPRLYEARASLLVSFNEYVDELKNNIENVIEAATPQQKNRRITVLQNSLEKIDSLTKDNSVYAGFCRWLINSSQVYYEAKQLVGQSRNPD